MQEWEYKTCFLNYSPYQGDPNWKGFRQTVLTDAELNQFGFEGWELVSVTRLTSQIGYPFDYSLPNESTWGLQYIFKRPKR